MFTPLLRPFPGLRPAPGRAAEVAAPPYDVVSEAEARQKVTGRPWSFLHISRAEVDLPPGTDPYAPEVYAKALENWRRMRAEGVLIQDPAPRYYVYRLTMGNHHQTGLVAAASVAAYDSGRIKRHELTRPVKEDDRVRQIDTLNAQTGPVFLVYPGQADIDRVLREATQAVPSIDITAEGGVRHELWVVEAVETQAFLTAAFDRLPALYVADGHHRSAAASRVAAARRASHPDEQVAHAYFLAVVFPHDQMKILPYNRVVRDLNGLEAAAFLARVGENFALTPTDQPVEPGHPGEFGLYLDHAWYRLSLDPSRIPHDPVARLDVSLLADQLLGPILGIRDARRDERIDFVGGIRGLAGLVGRVDGGDMRAAFSLFPTGIADLMAVADQGEIMPPKSTWFEPKLADGLISHLLD
ncbi:MAG: DUF1015 family protein [Pseudomonadota bacterium]